MPQPRSCRPRRRPPDSGPASSPSGCGDAWPCLRSSRSSPPVLSGCTPASSGRCATCARKVCRPCSRPRPSRSRCSSTIARTDAERWARDPQLAASTNDLARRALRTSTRSPTSATAASATNGARCWRRSCATKASSPSMPSIATDASSPRRSTVPVDSTSSHVSRPHGSRQVFGGRTQFIRPFAADPLQLVAAQPFLGTRPLAWVETPVRDAAGTVVAALGFAIYVDTDVRGRPDRGPSRRNRRSLCVRRQRRPAVGDPVDGRAALGGAHARGRPKAAPRSA